MQVHQKQVISLNNLFLRNHCFFFSGSSFPSCNHFHFSKKIKNLYHFIQSTDLNFIFSLAIPIFSLNFAWRLTQNSFGNMQFDKAAQTDKNSLKLLFA